MKRILVSLLCFLGTLIANAASLNKSIEDAITLPIVSAVSPSLHQRYTLISYQQITKDKGQFNRNYTLILRDNINNSLKQIDHAPSIVFPTWSPDGLSFAYIRCINNGCSLIVRNLEKAFNDIPLSIEFSALKWSPQSDSIYIVGFVSKPAESILKTIKSDSTITTPDQKLYLVSGVKSKSPIIRQVRGIEGSINQFDIPAIDAGFDVNNNILAYAHIPCNGDQCGDASKISLLNLKTAKKIAIPYFESVTAVDPKFSPDGKFLAFRQALKSDNGVINKIAYTGKICILEIKSNQVKCLADTFDSSPIILTWSKDNRTIYVYEAFHKTNGMQIYALDTASNQTPPRRITNENFWIDFTTLNVSPDNFLGFSSESQHRGQEAFQANLESWQQLQQLTKLQPKISAPLGSMESITWRSNDGMQIEGILIKPANYDKSKKYPLLVMGKGGPSGAWSKRFIGGCFGIAEKMFPACWSVLLNQGFVILLPNYRGSSGYGAQFFGANYKHFNQAYFDIMSGVDYLIKEKVADPDQLALWGWSYDGYTTAWTLGHTHRFKAAVMGDGLTDLISFANTTDARTYLSNFYGHNYLESNDYLRDSPIMYANQFTTPLMIIHGENDERVPVAQALELNNALHKLNKPVTLILLPDTGHVPTNPNIIYNLNLKVSDWLDKVIVRSD